MEFGPGLTGNRRQSSGALPAIIDFSGIQTYDPLHTTHVFYPYTHLS